jgi:pentose-5-phosphate-3-epimerase
MTGAADAVRAAMERITQVRHAITEGGVTAQDVPALYDELTDLYVAARAALERGEAQLRVSKERI